MSVLGTPRGGELLFISRDIPGQVTRIEIAVHGPKTLYHGPVESGRWLDMNMEARAAYRDKIAKHVMALAEEHDVHEWEINDENDDVRAYCYRKEFKGRPKVRG